MLICPRASSVSRLVKSGNNQTDPPRGNDRQIVSKICQSARRARVDHRKSGLVWRTHRHTSHVEVSTSCHRRKQRLARRHGGRSNRERNAIMQRLFATMLVVACVVGSSTAGFARGGGVGGGGGGGVFAHSPSLLLPAPQMAPAPSRIPAPLSSPAQAPTINGPVSQPAFQGMSGIGQ